MRITSIRLLLLLTVGALASVQAAERAPDNVRVIEDQLYVPAPPTKEWHVVAGRSLRDQLEQWADQSGWALHWSAQGPALAADVDVTFQAVDFQAAVTQFFAALPPDVQLVGTFHTGNNPKLLSVTSPNTAKGR